MYKTPCLQKQCLQCKILKSFPKNTVSCVLSLILLTLDIPFRTQEFCSYNVVKTFPNARPFCGLSSLGSHSGDSDTDHLYDVHEHVYW